MITEPPWQRAGAALASDITLLSFIESTYPRRKHCLQCCFQVQHSGICNKMILESTCGKKQKDILLHNELSVYQACMMTQPVILTLKRLRQEGHKCKPSRGHMVRFCKKKFKRCIPIQWKLFTEIKTIAEQFLRPRSTLCIRVDSCKALPFVFQSDSMKSKSFIACQLPSFSIISFTEYSKIVSLFPNCLLKKTPSSYTLTTGFMIFYEDNDKAVGTRAKATFLNIQPSSSQQARHRNLPTTAFLSMQDAYKYIKTAKVQLVTHSPF